MLFRSRDGRIMLDVEKGIEMNAGNVTKYHVNGFFCGFGQGYLGKEKDYETVVAGVDKAGGLSFINHPHEMFVNGGIGTENFNLFADLFTRYRTSLVGLECFNSGDSGGCGRIVWDGALEINLPRGKTIWGFANDDSHFERTIGGSSEVFLMPENTNKALRTAMENGTFFACSKKANQEMPGVVGTGEYAKILDVKVSEDNQTISLIIDDPDAKVTWISNGSKIVAEGSSINVAECEGIGFFVRANVINGGGIVCTQPFVLDDSTLSSKETPMLPQKLITSKESRKAKYDFIKKQIKKARSKSKKK